MKSISHIISDVQKMNKQLKSDNNQLKDLLLFFQKNSSFKHSTYAFLNHNIKQHQKQIECQNSNIYHNEYPNKNSKRINSNHQFKQDIKKCSYGMKRCNSCKLISQTRNYSHVDDCIPKIKQNNKFKSVDKASSKIYLLQKHSNDKINLYRTPIVKMDYTHLFKSYKRMQTLKLSNSTCSKKKTESSIGTTALRV